ncbi:hypothetical protein HOF40_02830 [Candidatus Parcubacteria bacterium]|jgi:hypothetical protein|nr:hypothetical protein [Candidatus Parcubacteria bacterium]MBT3948997.1 hypothetical protein [Candidatus Parcubacteria bacterium]
MLKQSNHYKIKVTVPFASADAVRDALAQAGAGKFNKYDNCSFMYPVKGRFRPLEGANPSVGEVGSVEEVDEMCIECICHKDILEEVIVELKKAHPYEEPAIDILPRFELE